MPHPAPSSPTNPMQMQMYNETMCDREKERCNSLEYMYVAHIC